MTLAVPLESSQDPLIGSVLDGRYRVVQELGRGGMGTVYVAEDIVLKRRYAMKVLSPELGREPAFVERFLREAQTIARLQHPNIVDIHSFKEDPRGVFFTMELLEGEDLDARIRARAQRPYNTQDVCEWALQIARAVTVVHDEGLIHRDLKAQNIFCARRRDGSEVLKLLDFGIARPEDGSDLTRTGVALGTPSHMAPEQIRNEKLDRRVDIYAFGVLLFKLLTGRLPFVGDSLQVAMQHCMSPVPRPSMIAPEFNIPSALDALVLKAMAKVPDERYTSMREIEQEMLAVLSEEGRTLARPLWAGSSGRLEPQAVPLPVPPTSPRADTLAHAPTALGPALMAPPDRAHPSVTPPDGAHVTQPVMEPTAARPAPARDPVPPPHSGQSLRMLATLAAGVAVFSILSVWLLDWSESKPPATADQALLSSTNPNLPDPTTAELVDDTPAKPAEPPPRPPRTTPTAETKVQPSAPSDETPFVEAKLSPSAPSDTAGTRQPAPKGSRSKQELVKAERPKISPQSSQLPESQPSEPPDARTSAAGQPPLPIDPITAIKERAVACRRTHNAVGSPPISVDYAIDTDGSVMRARPAADSDLGKCLAAAVKQARFAPGPIVQLGKKIAL